MIEQGRIQYQLLHERKNIPTYGSCWKSAIEHIDEGCRALSEETQSIIALHLANCFLEMSGHESYNCELEKKPNLRQICISSMTDRAFNVYTEFYTHTQNICWFLHGQIWQETIAENTFHVGKQIELSVKNQENILQIQQESLHIQEKLLKHGHDLEKIMENFYFSTLAHQETLVVMSSSLKSLQSWLIGEFSWIDLLIFYVSTSIIITILTSTTKTAGARLPLWIMLLGNSGVERFICMYVINTYSGDDLHSIMSKYIWWSRKCFYIFALITLFYFLYRYEDLQAINNNLLRDVYNQNILLLKKIDQLNNLESTTRSLRESPCNSEASHSLASTNKKQTDHGTSQENIFRITPHLKYNSKYNLRSKSRSPWDKYC
ncbi:hypothetical protein FQR65_LT12065 [Abscondita terminalis]|nr:hypothetical protein FQR65_LT12065 [Abscondita terminalis]